MDAESVAQRMPDDIRLTMEEGGSFNFSPARAFNLKAFQSGGAGMVGTAPNFLAFLECIRSGGAPLISPELNRLAKSNCIGNLTRDDPS
ncbi:MAG: hypothetical protein ABIV25_02680 [Paracoccaceae bacterium]